MKIWNFSFTKMLLKISSAKWRPFCPGGDELTIVGFLQRTSTVRSHSTCRCCHCTLYGPDEEIVTANWETWWRHQMKKKKHFPRYWSFVRGIHRLPVNSPHKGQWRGALMFSLICAWKNGWVNNRETDDLRCHYDVTVMYCWFWCTKQCRRLRRLQVPQDIVRTRRRLWPSLSPAHNSDTQYLKNTELWQKICLTFQSTLCLVMA